MFFISSSNFETEKIGGELARSLSGGDILLLSGELGSGKTTFVKGIAKRLEIEKEITSPTFTLMNIYEIKNNKFKRLVHIDTYRLENEEELIQIGIEDYLGMPDVVCVIEWPEKIQNLLINKKTKKITLEHIDSKRKITVED